VLIMPSGWMAASGCVHGSQRCKAKWTGCSASDGGRGRCAGVTSVKSRETDRENGYENRSPVFSYERSTNKSYLSTCQLPPVSITSNLDCYSEKYANLPVVYIFGSARRICFISGSENPRNSLSVNFTS